MVFDTLRKALAAAALAVTGGAALACGGSDILPTLPEAERAAILARAQAAPFPEGNLWRASRDEAEIVVVGTYHLPDPRLDPLLDRVAPLVAAADLVVVEALPEEAEALARAMAETPELAYITDGPTLRDLLSEAEWQRYADEMAARGVPGFMASRFRPWLAFTMLSLPVCAIEAAMGAGQGLDDRIVARARAAGVPVIGLEGVEVLFQVFDSLTPEESLDILRATILTADRAEDMLATLTRAYFDGQHRLVWEFGRSWMPEAARPLFPPQRTGPLYDRLEAALLQARNRDWMAQLQPLAVPGARLVLAVGAAHLSGPDGVLDLLHRDGWTLHRLEM